MIRLSDLMEGAEFGGIPPRARFGARLRDFGATVIVSV